MPGSHTSTTASQQKEKKLRRNPPPSRKRPSTRKATKQKRPPSKTVKRILEAQECKRVQKAYQNLKADVFQLFTKAEVEAEASKSGFCKRESGKIKPFEFVLCCVLAALVEPKRGFASVWRMLSAAAGIQVARSATTQRFGEGSSAMMQALFIQAVERLPQPKHPELLGKLDTFKQVLAQDGSVLKLSPLLGKLFPSTRTNCMEAAGKIHATADVVHRRILAVTITGERNSELQEARDHGIESGTLYIRDLGYTDYDEFAAMIAEQADLLMRLKDNANPLVLRVRHGVVGPRRSEGKKFQELAFCKTQQTFDIDARFKSFDGGTTDLRVVGHYNPETDKYHCYVTTLPSEQFSVEELETLYSLRWVIELLFKLLKSSCHLDHLDTKDPNSIRTHIYASLLGATLLSAVIFASAKAAGIPVSAISVLTVGIAAPLLVLPLMLLWCERELSYDELAAMIIRVITHGCRDQNRARTAKKWGNLSL
jgi:hypothetical protein